LAASIFLTAQLAAADAADNVREPVDAGAVEATAAFRCITG
jgi:hypothetical protein